MMLLTTEHIPIYYINLASAVGRRAEMERQLTALGLEAQRIEAVTPAEISDEDVRAYCNPERYRWLKPVELACTLSHIRAWRTILASGAPRAVVLEDDAVLSSRLPEFLAAYQGLGDQAGLVKIEVCPDRVRAESRPRSIVAGVELRRIFGFSGGTAGYIISTAFILQAVDRPKIRQFSFDRALFDTFLPLSRELGFLQADPGLVVQADQLAEALVGVEGSSIKPHLALRFRTSSGSPWRRWAYGLRHWIDDNVIVGAQKTRLDLSGVKKRTIGLEL